MFGPVNSKHTLVAGLWALAAWLMLTSFNWANGASLSPGRLAQTGLATLGILAIHQWLKSHAGKLPAWVAWLAWACLWAAGVWAIHRGWVFDLLADLFLVIGLAALLRFTLWLVEEAHPVVQWLTYLGMSLVAGGAATALGQIETRFSEEEFFVAVQAAQLAVYWLALLLAARRLARVSRDAPASSNSSEGQRKRRARRLAAGLAALALCAFGGWTVVAYQNSFYGNNPPEFRGMTMESPFQCGQVPAATANYPPEETRKKLIELLAAKETKYTPDYALLALAQDNAAQAGQFREQLLAEARQQLYTGPAYSVKYGQCLAARRAYFYPLVVERFPEVFSTTEQDEIQNWFWAINRRALTVEPIDWFYALAFGDWPQGPYENQECGAGLLALLEANHLADPTLSERNQAYLTQKRRGWQARFRNNDDAYTYQIEFLQYANFQYRNNQLADPGNIRKAIEWALYQALPDGGKLRYNHVSAVPAAEIAYWGAGMLGRADFMWLAGRSAETMQAQQQPIDAFPGLEAETNVASTSPTWGSCLLFGQTGLPTRVGPLAPDKIVFRDGWEAEAQYLLLNLRFTGWHRYKATNSVVMFYQDGLLLGEDSQGEAFAWLPEGRSLFRDKRIPRQNLNGLLVGRSGLDAALYRLTGLNGPWAQNAPFYAEVERFETSKMYDLSQTSILDWNSWRQKRTIYFYHQGPVVIVDEASGPARRPAAISWHLREGAIQLTPMRYRLRAGASPAEMVLQPLDNRSEPARIEFTASGAGEMGRVLYQPPAEALSGNSQFRLASVLLTREWAGATVEWQAGGKTLSICQNGQCVRIAIPEAVE